jgi:hypothetical protein
MAANEFKQLKKIIESDPKEMALFKEDPVKYLEQLKPIDTPWVFMTIVIMVGIVLFTSVVLGSYIIMDAPDSEKAKVPEFLVGIGSTALGALVGLLAPSPK